MSFDQKAYLKAWRAANKEKCAAYRESAKQKQTPEERAAYQKAYREANKERLTEQRRAYAAAHRDEYRARNQVYYDNNAEKVRERAKANYRANKPKYAEATRAWKQRNKHLMQEQARARYRDDVQFKLSMRLRNRLNIAIRKDSKVGSAVRLLGCSIAELVAHLEARFQPGMTWRNWSVTGWHIDHIRPLASFDLTDPEQLALACHYTNLQPMWATENMSKGKREPERFSP